MKKISAYIWAFIAAIVLFFTAGVFTAGSFTTTGDSLAVAKGETVYYDITLTSGKRLADVYVNIGSIYKKTGESANVAVKYSTSATSTSFSTFSSAKPVANIAAKTGEENYGWIRYNVEKGVANVRRISVSADCGFELNEIVCFDLSGEKVSMAAGDDSKAFTEAEIAATYDAPRSFTKNTSKYHTLSRDEAYTLTSVQNVLRGKAAQSGDVYTLRGDFNYLWTAFMTPAVAVFGASPFAVRITPLIASCVMLVFAFLLTRKLFKSDKYAFLFTLCGMAATAFSMTSPYALVASAVLASAYFAYRFFAGGISSKHVVKGGVNVLLSGVFSAIALAMETAALFPMLAVLVLIGFGMRRQYLAYKLELAKTAGEGVEKTTKTGEKVLVNKAAEKVNADYRYKTRVCYCFAALTFVALTFALILIATVICNYAVMRALGTQTGFGEAMWQGVASSLRSKLPFVPAAATTLQKTVFFAELLLVAGATVLTVFGFVKKTDCKHALRFRRGYFVLLGGAVAATVAFLIKSAPATFSTLFALSYVGFLPLLLTVAETATAERKNLKTVTLVAYWAVAAGMLALIALQFVGTFGFAVLG